MVTQIYDKEDFTNTNTYFIVAKSEEQLYDEMKEFIKTHGTDENRIYAYENPVKPSKINLRPEYSMELLIQDKNDLSRPIFFKKVW